ncbi:hypothetical protein B0H16DRAFT_1697223, partial [Mycena metata]
MTSKLLAIPRQTQTLLSIKTVLEEALAFYTSGLGAVQLKYWFTDYLSREPYTEDDYFDVAVVIGRHDGEPEISLRRVSGFDSEENHWKGIVQNSTNGQGVVILDDTFYGLHKGDPIFCWERPLTPLQGVGYPTGLLKGISYGGIENAHGSDGDGHQKYFVTLRSPPAEMENTAAAIAAGYRGQELWPALALDCGAQMCVRPDVWPSRPLEVLTTETRAEEVLTDSVFHALPPEVLLQILPLLPLADFR